MFPFVDTPAAAVLAELSLPPAVEVSRRGRIPLVADALRRLHQEVGQHVVIGGYLPGPLTLAQHLLPPAQMLTSLIEEPERAGRLLDKLVDILAEVALTYRAAGADYLTIHEMGGSPGYIGRRLFQRLLLPRLQRLVAILPPPVVLSVCGDTNAAIGLLAEVGAGAISVDQLCDVAAARRQLGDDTLLFGNIDPVATLVEGDEADVRRAVAAAMAAGVDAVWPGCDLWPAVPPENMLALVQGEP